MRASFFMSRAATSKQTETKARLRREREFAKMSLDIVTGAQNLATLSPAELFDRERPDDLQAMFKLARNWDKQNWFVERVNRLKQAFYHFGFQLVAVQKGEQKKLEKWLEANMERRELLDRYINSVWGEWLLLDNVVSFWRKEKVVLPFLLLPERCKYSDAMGIEKLKVSLQYEKRQFTDSHGSALEGWSATEIRRYTSGEIVLSEDQDEYFREFPVAKRVARATAYVCGLGFFDLFLNEQKVSDDVMDPALSDYAKALYYVTFDVTKRLRPGANALGVILGNGRYFPPRMIPSASTNSTFGYPKLLLQLAYDTEYVPHP